MSDLVRNPEDRFSRVEAQNLNAALRHPPFQETYYVVKMQGHHNILV